MPLSTRCVSSLGVDFSLMKCQSAADSDVYSAIAVWWQDYADQIPDLWDLQCMDIVGCSSEFAPTGFLREEIKFLQFLMLFLFFPHGFLFCFIF